MEILVAVLAFAGALLAAVAAGALASRLREEPEGWLIAWTVAAAGLALALGGIGFGHLVGFGTWTFKIYQLGGSLLAPLWMGIGLVQLLADRVPPRFAAWLGGIAVTVVVAVVILFDPVAKAGSMGKSLPLAATHWSPIFAGYALFGVHIITALLMVGGIVLAVLRWRRGDEYDLDNLHATLVVAPSGLALLGALRFTVPGVFTTALLLVAAAGLWYCVLRPLAPYEDDEEDAITADRDRAHQKSFAEPPPQQQAPAPVRPRHSSGLGELVAEYRAGDSAPEFRGGTLAAEYRPEPAFDSGPATGLFLPNGAAPQQPPAPEYGRHGAPQNYPQTGPQPIPPGYGRPQEPSMPATGIMYPGADVFGASAPAAGNRPSPKIFGLLTVFTLMDGYGEAFDRLAEEAVEAVRRNEPDTLLYVCHGVKSAPLQRIVYELYRDDVAYADHQRQPHVERFIGERQPMVLATNVIELTVNAAKVMPLPTALF
ncbi:antibiotic biosynthesis monooxygenase [Nonomuraea sp. NPDC050328]|uniref:putative quinol monooxygenase n=1 Tax=Nonomuraea sp. NPDC050328 TaxID=3364361 RepID=UPI0037B99785